MPKLTPSIITLDPATASYAEVRDIRHLTNQIWPTEGFSADNSARDLINKQQAGSFKPGSEQWYIIRELSTGKLIAHAATFPRRITVDGKAMTILALGGVCSHPNFRGQGLGAAVVRAAFARVDRGEFPFCLYQTTEPNRTFYEHLGAAVIANRIVNSLGEKPEANPFWDPLAMAYPVSRPFPAGTVDLLGPGY